MPANARVYLIAGTQHGGRVGLKPDPGPCANPRNPHNPAPALHIVEASGQQFRLSYAELSQRSNQVANWLVALGARKGDRILIGKYSGSDIKIDEEDLVIVREDEILAVLDK